MILGGYWVFCFLKHLLSFSLKTHMIPALVKPAAGYQNYLDSVKLLAAGFTGMWRALDSIVKGPLFW
jgi:hypothetical protein